jgi:hypothetical protein
MSLPSASINNLEGKAISGPDRLDEARHRFLRPNFQPQENSLEQEQY